MEDLGPQASADNRETYGPAFNYGRRAPGSEGSHTPEKARSLPDMFPQITQLSGGAALVGTQMGEHHPHFTDWDTQAAPTSMFD